MEETFDEDIDKFGIHLNNFIINARTVTWLMQKEFANCEHFSEWYDLKVNEMKLKGFDKFRIIRNAIEKEGNLKNTMVIHVNIEGKNDSGTRLLTAEIGEDGKMKNKVYGKFEIKPFFGPLGSFDLTKMDEDIFGQCREYLDFLSNLVDEAYEKFNKK